MKRFVRSGWIVLLCGGVLLQACYSPLVWKFKGGGAQVEVRETDPVTIAVRDFDDARGTWKVKGGPNALGILHLVTLGCLPPLYSNMEKYTDLRRSNYPGMCVNLDMDNGFARTIYTQAGCNPGCLVFLNPSLDDGSFDYTVRGSVRKSGYSINIFGGVPFWVASIVGVPIFHHHAGVEAEIQLLDHAGDVVMSNTYKGSGNALGSLFYNMVTARPVAGAVRKAGLKFRTDMDAALAAVPPEQRQGRRAARLRRLMTELDPELPEIEVLLGVLPGDIPPETVEKVRREYVKKLTLLEGLRHYEAVLLRQEMEINENAYRQQLEANLQRARKVAHHYTSQLVAPIVTGMATGLILPAPTSVFQYSANQVASTVIWTGVRQQMEQSFARDLAPLDLSAEFFDSYLLGMAGEKYQTVREFRAGWMKKYREETLALKDFQELL
ncbi:hypothetical protein JW905_18590 [bacterium]|nr:hypothetical protein [candidate division CSSED10-310 bacterium]